MPRRRLRTFILWTGTTLCVLIAAAFVASGWWFMAVQIPTGHGPGVAVNGGACYVMLFQGTQRLFLADPVHGMFLSRPHWYDWNRWDRSDLHFYVPLYVLFFAVAVPTLLAWRFWSKPPKPGHCRCGYNLAGLPEPRCPECGRPFAPNSRRGMRRRSRRPRVAKWSGVVLFVLIIAAGIANGYFGAAFHFGECTIWMVAGSVNISVWEPWRWSGMTEFMRFGEFRAPSWRIGVANDEILIPLWVPLLLVAISTALLWYLDRRPLPGHCSCGYNLTGNVSGTCPECGYEVQ